MEYGISDRAQYVMGDARKIPFEDNLFDGAFGNGSRHEWAEPINVFREIYRVLKPGGKYLVSDLRRDMHSLVKWFVQAVTKPEEIRQGLRSSIKAHGGKVLYNTAAEKILVKDGAVTGVLLSNGKTFSAGIVVSNASAMTTFGHMVPREAVPADYMGKLESYKPSIASFIVWLGLNRELRGKIKGCGIHVSSGRGPEADYEAALKGEVDQGSFSVSIYDNIYEGYSKPGTSSLMLLFLCGYEPWRRFEEDSRKGVKREY